MTETLPRLIEALRNELQQYGEMLALLDQQQETVQLRGADDILHSISSINAQSQIIQAARQHRRSLQQQLAQRLNQSEEATFAQLIPSLPEHYQPLVTALVQENNELLDRVRERAQQNHLQLQRSLDLMQRFITTLSPQDPLCLPQPEPTTSIAETTALYEAIA
jgi:hypothetical protein